MSFNLTSWMKAGRYLPQPMRDFHDSKEVFKTMHALVDVGKHDYAKDVNWIAGQCYVIDIFLWFMAKRGWTLQRVRVKGGKGQFGDLAADIAARREAEAEEFRRYLLSRKPATPAAIPPAAAAESEIKHLTNKETID